MTPPDLLTTLRARGVTVTRRGDRVRCEPAGNLIDDLRPAITRHKAALLMLLDRERFTADPRPDLTDDSGLWRRLLAAAYDRDGHAPAGVFGALHGLRCEGARLVVAGGRVRLESGELGDEYQALKQSSLTPHTAAIMRLFATIAHPEEA
ncbi:MAG: hypothetical protein ACRDJW_04605 [Thermomicrobiales bacterium]